MILQEKRMNKIRNMKSANVWSGKLSQTYMEQQIYAGTTITVTEKYTRYHSSEQKTVPNREWASD